LKNEKNSESSEIDKEKEKEIIYINKPQMADFSPLNLNNIKLKNNENFMPNFYYIRHRKLLFVKKYNPTPFKFDVDKLFSY